MFEAQLATATDSSSKLLGLIGLLTSQVNTYRLCGVADFNNRVQYRQANTEGESLEQSQLVVQAEMEAEILAISDQLQAVVAAVNEQV